MVTVAQRHNVIGENYNLIVGMDEYISGLPEEERASFTEKLKETPTEYVKFLETLLAGEVYAARIQANSGIRFRPTPEGIPDLSVAIPRGGYSVSDVVSTIVDNGDVEFITVSDPDSVIMDFNIRIGEKIMEEIDESQIPKAPVVDEAGLEDAKHQEEQSIDSLEVTALKEKAVSAAEKKRIEADYKRYMSALKKTDPEEHKRLTALHKEFKKENKALEKLVKKWEQYRREDAKFIEKDNRGLLTPKEEKKWDEINNKQRALFHQINDFRFKIMDANAARVEKGIISERLAGIRNCQMQDLDSVRLPMRTLEQSMDAGQLATDIAVDGTTYYRHESDCMDKSPIDNVTKKDPIIRMEDERLQEEKKARLEEFRKVCDLRQKGFGWRYKLNDAQKVINDPELFAQAMKDPEAFVRMQEEEAKKAQTLQEEKRPEAEKNNEEKSEEIEEISDEDMLISD